MSQGYPPSSLASPKKVVWCRGGSRYVDGWWGLKELFSWLLVFLVDRTLVFDSLVLGFLVPKFQSPNVSQFQRFEVSEFLSF